MRILFVAVLVCLLLGRPIPAEARPAAELLFPSEQAAASDLVQAQKAYEERRFAEARAGFAELLDRGSHDPAALLHAMGHCAMELGDTAKGLWYYLRAEHHGGRNAALREAIQEAREELGLPEAAEPPAGRSVPGPDGLWLWLALGLQSVGLILLIFGPERPRKRRYGVLVLLLGLLSAGVLVRRLLLPEAPLVIVLAAEVPVYAEPGDTAALFELRAGEWLRLLEERDGFVRVRHRLGEAWLRSGAEQIGRIQGP
jgi:hypothetical protein